MSRDVIEGEEQTRRDAFRIKAAAVVRALHAEGMTTSDEMLRSIAALSEVRGERAKATRDLGARLRDPTISVKSLRRISDGMGMRPQRNLAGRNQLYAEVKATWLQQVRTLRSFSVAAGACQPGGEASAAKSCSAARTGEAPVPQHAEEPQLLGDRFYATSAWLDMPSSRMLVRWACQWEKVSVKTKLSTASWVEALRDSRKQVRLTQSSGSAVTGCWKRIKRWCAKSRRLRN